MTSPASSKAKRPATTTFYATTGVSLNGRPYATGDALPELCCDAVTVDGQTFQRDVFDQLYITDTEGRHWRVDSLGATGRVTATFDPRYTPEHTTLATLAARGIATTDRKIAQRCAELQEEIVEAAEADRAAGTTEKQPPLVKQLAELRGRLVEEVAA